MSPNKKEIPNYKSEDEERAFWDKESPLDYLDKNKAKKVKLANLKPLTEVITSRSKKGPR